MEEVILDINELDELCDYWVNLLGLNQWKIYLTISRECNFRMAGVQGECSWVISNSSATIRILDPIDYPDSPFLQDMEKTLVHELLHLHFCYFDNFKDDSLELMMMERVVDQLARTLVELKRSGNKIEASGIGDRGIQKQSN